MRNIVSTGSLMVLVLFSVLLFGKAEIYIVTLEGEPVVSYKGGIEGFEATAVEPD
ncbi:UNVERIFIED_CONTAM: Subtilisin-like protease SBT2.6 [Sesamum radiatum]